MKSRVTYCYVDIPAGRRWPRLMTIFCSICVTLGLLLVSEFTAAAQGELTWRELSGAPYVGRHNDVYFVNPRTGWIVNGDGEIYRTDDGGGTWTRQLRQSGSHFRSVGFLDEARGFAGNVGLGEFGATDMFAMYETADGGLNWTPVPAWHGRTPTGLCGMHVVNDTVVVAVGRVRGPAFFARTTDAGATWRSTDMAGYAAGLIDVFFSSPDTGFAVGLTNVEHELSSAVILYTEDGGRTWERRFRSTRTGEWAWKISFPSADVGYVSLQRNTRTPIFILKTTDGGATWEEKLFSNSSYFVQGIGFIDENRGWIGGNSASPVYHTADGGETWQSESLRPRLNRFRFLGDTLGYAVGRTVHKLADWTATSTETAPELASFALDQNYPNPFRETTAFSYTIAQSGPVRVDVFDLLGRRVAVLVNGLVHAGRHEVLWNGADAAGRSLAAGTYFYQLISGDRKLTRALYLVR